MAEVDYEDIELHERLRAARAVIAQQKAEIERLRGERDNAQAEASMKGYRLDDALDEIERLGAAIPSEGILGVSNADVDELLAEVGRRPAVADDIIARLRCSYADPPCEQCTFCAARAEIERLQAIVATIDALHFPLQSMGTRRECAADGDDWPCSTHLFIHPKEARRG